MIIVQAASRDVRRFCVTLRTLIRWGCVEEFELVLRHIFIVSLMPWTYPIRVDTFHQSSGPFVGLDGDFQDTIHVHMVALNLIASRRLRDVPADQYALVELAL